MSFFKANTLLALSVGAAGGSTRDHSSSFSYIVFLFLAHVAILSPWREVLHCLQLIAPETQSATICPRMPRVGALRVHV